MARQRGDYFGFISSTSGHYPLSTSVSSTFIPICTLYLLSWVKGVPSALFHSPGSVLEWRISFVSSRWKLQMISPSGTSVATAASAGGRPNSFILFFFFHTAILFWSGTSHYPPARKCLSRLITGRVTGQTKGNVLRQRSGYFSSRLFVVYSRIILTAEAVIKFRNRKNLMIFLFIRDPFINESFINEGYFAGWRTKLPTERKILENLSHKFIPFRPTPPKTEFLGSSTKIKMIPLFTPEVISNRFFTFIPVGECHFSARPRPDVSVLTFGSADFPKHFTDPPRGSVTIPKRAESGRPEKQTHRCRRIFSTWAITRSSFYFPQKRKIGGDSST